ncbi:LysE family translocator [Actinomadura kijaniata]|uniref:LysE family translocator n=1 Tax=Actinomadura kijaniata TaxID=46161 RepID=UPI003F1DB7BD
MTVAGLLAFAGLCLVLAITPGPDTFLVLRWGLSSVRDGVLSAAGSGAGSLLWAATVAFGLSAFLQRSAGTFTALKIAGGLYLLYLGVTGLRYRARRHGPDEGPPRGPVAAGAGPALRSGLLSCLLNPKVGLFFLAVVPQFLPAGDVTAFSVMVLGAIDAVVAFAWLALVAVAAARASAWLRRPGVTQGLHWLSSALLALLGLGVVAAAI